MTLGMHLLAQDFEIPTWHGWELLSKMKSAKIVDHDLIREIYEALEKNGDLTRTWTKAKHTEFARIFGPALTRSATHRKMLVLHEHPSSGPSPCPTSPYKKRFVSVRMPL